MSGSVCLLCEREQTLMKFGEPCNHEVCEDCSVEWVRQQAQLFVGVRCPLGQCGDVPTASLACLPRLEPSTLQQLRSYERYRAHVQDPHARSCCRPDCGGLLDISVLPVICKTCGFKHCAQCLRQFHPGGCTLDADDAAMRAAGLRNCPQCQVWVSKSDGCDYISCRCGATFCFRCGALFADDPCRKQAVWRQGAAMREALGAVRLSLGNPDGSVLGKQQLIQRGWQGVRGR